MMRMPFAMLAALLVGAVASAPARAADEREDETCPRLAVLSDADHSTVFDGEGRDVTNIVYKATLGAAALKCKHRSGNRLKIDISAVIGIERGLAATERDIEVPYFIAVIDPEQLVVTKQQGLALIKAERGSRTAAATIESATITLELSEETMGADLQVLLGLQLSEDQLDYNRAGY